MPIYRGDGGSGDSTTDAYASQVAQDAATATEKANEASASAAAAATSETNAATSETNAATSETNAATSETNAATSASNAATSETNAATSATNAATSETNAATSATNAATSETNASGSATAAANSATAAATSETNAATSATNAATSETNAATSATNAANSATAAATSATNAANSATAAATSATAAANSYDDFDDRYLGAKASDPSVDNDGDALLTGALYFNTTSNVMKVYTGSAWNEVADTLDSLTDVTITSVSNGQVLKYNGSAWVNDTDAGGIALTDLSVTTNAVGTAALSYNNTNGVFSYTPPDLSSYLTSETDTLDSVTGRGATTSNDITTGRALIPVVSYASNQDAPYLIAAASGWTGATTTWQTFGLQHRIKTTSSGVPRVTIDTNNGEAFCVNNQGDVGIGTGEPASHLHVYNGTDAEEQVIIAEVSGGSSNGAGVSLRRSGTEMGRINADYFDGLTFHTTTGSGGAATERMRIDTGGAVRIGSGTSTVDMKLKQGPTAISVGGSTSGAIISTYGTAAGSGHVGIEVPANDANDGFYIATDSNYDGTVDTLALKVNAAGSVCVGHSDPDQNGPRSALYVCSEDHNTGVSDNTNRPDIFVGASSTGVGAGAGGEIRFGSRVYGTSGFAALKGYITDGTANYNMGYLDLNMRASNSSASMTRRFRFSHTGDFHADGNVIAYSTSISDEKFKDNIQPITGALDTVDALRGVTFTWNAGSREGQRDYGLIAQEVEKVLPEVVHDSTMPLMTDDDNETLYKTIDYDKLVSVLIEAVSELRAEVEELKNG